MTLLFEPLPGDPDAEALDVLLDAMLAGRPAPTSSHSLSQEALSLAACTRAIQQNARLADARADAYLAKEPDCLRWDEVFRTAYPSPLPDVDRSEPSPAGVQPLPLRRRSHGLQPSGRALTAVVVLLLLVGSFTGGWWFGQRETDAVDGAAQQPAGFHDESTPYSTAYSRPEMQPDSSTSTSSSFPFSLPEWTS